MDSIFARLCALHYQLKRFDGEFHSTEPLLQELDAILRQLPVERAEANAESPSHDHGSRTVTPHICDNERCTYHLPLLTQNAKAPHIYIAEGLTRVRVDRYRYQSVDTPPRDLWLCHACHAAIEMQVEPHHSQYAARRDMQTAQGAFA